MRNRHEGELKEKTQIFSSLDLCNIVVIRKCHVKQQLLLWWFWKKAFKNIFFSVTAVGIKQDLRVKN